MGEIHITEHTELNQSAQLSPDRLRGASSAPGIDWQDTRPGSWDTPGSSHSASCCEGRQSGYLWRSGGVGVPLHMSCGPAGLSNTNGNIYQFKTG